MAQPTRDTQHPLIERLLEDANQFDFFQVVRLLQRAAQLSAESHADTTSPVGHDGPPGDEHIRFGVLATQGFPSGSVASIRRRTLADHLPEQATTEAGTSAELSAEVIVNFIGLTGAQGVLPHHYTSMLLERARSKDHSLRDFFDLFNHRIISFFYRSWAKNQFYVGYESTSDEPSANEPDPFSQCLMSIVGIGLPSLRKRVGVNDEFLLRHSGALARTRRTAHGLETMLGDYFSLPVVVDQFCEHRARLRLDDRWQLPQRQLPQGRNNRLGAGMVLGRRVWLEQDRFRVRFGPLTYEQFKRFWPTGDWFQSACRITRFYVGLEFEFEIHPMLSEEQIPEFRLGRRVQPTSRLGWNTWLRSKARQAKVKDVTFLVPLDDQEVPGNAGR